MAGQKQVLVAEDSEDDFTLLRIAFEKAGEKKVVDSFVERA